jgi:hypothetical protein
MVATDRAMKREVLRARREGRVLGLVEMGTDATLSPLLPAWISISMV